LKTGDIKIAVSVCCKCGCMVHRITTFLALKMALAWWLVPFNRAKKVSGTSKSLDIVPGPFRILEMAP